MSDEACFLYILQGENRSVSELEQVCVAEKEAVLMKCGNYFTKMFPSPGSKTYEAVAVHFYPEVLKKIYAQEIPEFLKQPLKKTSRAAMAKIKVDVLLQKYFDSILFYFSNPELVTDELIVLKLKELFLLLEHTQNAPVIKELLHNLFRPHAYSFKEIIEAHVYSDLNLEELAALSNNSVSSFKRKFKKLFQDSPARYIKNRKLKRAAELLILSQQNISEIAFDCGFNDLSNFSTSFREKFGCSPSEYRQRAIVH